MTQENLPRDIPGPLFRLKTGTDAATPSPNGIIAQNLLRLSSLLEDDSYKTLAKQTCGAFAAEILQHPFLYVNLLDVIVGLKVGVKSVTGVLGDDTTPTQDTRMEVETQQSSGTREDISARPAAASLIQKLREETGPAFATSTAVVALVDVCEQGRTSKYSWIKERNPLFKDLRSGKNFLLVCEAGACRTVDIPAAS